MTEKTDTITVQLSKPISFNGETATSLTFREPTAGDICLGDMVEGQFQKSLAIMAGMAGITLPLMKEVSARDLRRIEKEAAPFLEALVEAMDG